MILENSHIEKIALSFLLNKNIINITPLESGLINSTFLISYNFRSNYCKFILQEINSNVFKIPEDILYNYSLLEDSITNNKSIFKESFINQYILPKMLINQISHKKYYKYKNNYWRAFEFIPLSKTFQMIGDPTRSFNMLRALSTFHLLSSELETNKLKTIIPNFHNTPFIFKTAFLYSICLLILSWVIFSDLKLQAGQLSFFLQLVKIPFFTIVSFSLPDEDTPYSLGLLSS